MRVGERVLLRRLEVDQVDHGVLLLRWLPRMGRYCRLKVKGVVERAPGGLLSLQWSMCLGQRLCAHRGREIPEHVVLHCMEGCGWLGEVRKVGQDGLAGRDRKTLGSRCLLERVRIVGLATREHGRGRAKDDGGA